MVFPFLFALICDILAWKSLYAMDHSFVDYCFSTFFLGVLTIAAFMVGYVFALLIGCMVPKRWTGPNITKLVSLRSGDSVTGSFFLGTGSIGTSQYYFFYKEAGRGYQPGKIEVNDDVTIFEENREDGELKTYTRVFVSSLFDLVAAPWGQKHEFVIPEGSLKKNFVVQ